MDMDKGPTAEQMLSSAGQHLHQAILNQRVAIEELQANNRELAAILDEFLSVRGELRGVAGNHIDGNSLAQVTGENGLAQGVDGDGIAQGAKARRPKAAPTPKDLDLAQLQREAARALKMGQHAMRESALLRLRSHKVRLALRNGAGDNHKPAVADHGGLSNRERQVLSLIVAGKSSKQIAAELGISFKTAVTHRASLMGKLDVHEVASVVRVAIRQGLT
jgi:DNA-binding CsgD family transcriptional regulator